MIYWSKQQAQSDLIAWFLMCCKRKESEGHIKWVVFLLKCLCMYTFSFSSTLRGKSTSRVSRKYITIWYWMVFYKLISGSKVRFIKCMYRVSPEEDTKLDIYLNLEYENMVCAMRMLEMQVKFRRKIYKTFNWSCWPNYMASKIYRDNTIRHLFTWKVTKWVLEILQLFKNAINLDSSGRSSITL